MNPLDFQIAIMAGGKSRRMGQNKALLTIDGVPIIERVIQKAWAFAPTVTPFIVTNTPTDYAHLKLPTLPDSVVDSGAIGGIHAGLMHAKEHGIQWLLVLACDMPFVSVDLLRIMHAGIQRKQTTAQVILPHTDDYAHVLHAFYHTDLLPSVTRLIESEQFAVRALLQDVPIQTITETTLTHRNIPLYTLMNCNTPADLEKARRIAQKLS